MFEKRFDDDPGCIYSGVDAARKWLKRRGYSIGRLHGADPIAVSSIQGRVLPKWPRMTAADYAAMCGTIEPIRTTFAFGGALVRLERAPFGEDR